VLVDPVETEGKGFSGPKGIWNGEYYVSFGHDPKGRNWQDAVRYGFISGGGGSWYSKTLFLLKPGDRVWVNVPKKGYVGVGRVIAPAVRANEFEVDVDGVKRPFLDVAEGSYGANVADDEEKSEYFVSIEWTDTRPLAEAVSELGFFGNQNTVCRPRTSKWDHTVERLKRHFRNVN